MGVLAALVMYREYSSCTTALLWRMVEEVDASTMALLRRSRQAAALLTLPRKDQKLIELRALPQKQRAVHSLLSLVLVIRSNCQKAVVLLNASTMALLRRSGPAIILNVYATALLRLGLVLGSNSQLSAVPNVSIALLWLAQVL